MKKKVLGLCLILLISVVLIVSCSPDPIKKNKAIGTWEMLEEGEEPYPDVLYTLTITEGNFTLEIAMVDVEEPIGTVKGTWTASTTTDGVLKVTEASGYAEEAFPVGTETSFAATDKKLYVEAPEEAEEPMAMIFTKK